MEAMKPPSEKSLQEIVRRLRKEFSQHGDECAKTLYGNSNADCTCGVRYLFTELERRCADLEKIAEASIFLRNSGYDGPFIGWVCEEMFKAIAQYEQNLTRPVPEKPE